MLFWRSLSFWKQLSVICLVVALSNTPKQSQAADINLPDLGLGDFDNIVEEFSGNFIFNSVSPASSIDTLLLPFLGFEFGVIAGVTEVPEVEKLINTAKPGTNLDLFPHGGIFLGLSSLYGIGFEAAYIPSIDQSNFSIDYKAFALKWTITDAFFDWLPVDIAARFHYSNPEISYKQTIQNDSTQNVAVDATITFEDTIWGGQLLVGKEFLGLVNPYAGLGFVKADGSLTVSAAGSTTITIFSQSFSATLASSQKAESKPSSFHYFAGLELDLWILKLGAEFAHAYETKSYTGKLSFDF